MLDGNSEGCPVGEVLEAMLGRFDGDSLGILDDNSEGHNVNSSEGGTLGEVLEAMLGRFD